MSTLGSSVQWLVSGGLVTVTPEIVIIVMVLLFTVFILSSIDSKNRASVDVCQVVQNVLYKIYWTHYHY